MSLRCPDCGIDLVKHIVITELGPIDGWDCQTCDVFYDTENLKNLIYDV